jgi:hypothetical protein
VQPVPRFIPPLQRLFTPIQILVNY